MSSPIHAAIASRFCQPEWATFFEVRDATGFAGAGRSADAVAMNCYPSRGLEVHGFEVKSDRRDMQREIKQPDKSAAVQKYCDRWWLVVADGVMRDYDLLPPTWGLMVMHGGGLKVVTQAPKLEAKPIDRQFMAAMFRAAAKDSESKIPALVEGRRRELEADFKARLEEAKERVRGEGAELVRLAEDLKRETGFDLNHWSTRRHLITYVKIAQTLELHGYGALATLIRGCREMVNAAEAVAKQHGVRIEDA